MTAHATRAGERGRASSLEAAGLTQQRAVHWNLGPPELYEHAVRRAEGVITEGGAFCAVTAPHTGRSPNDKFIVREPAAADEIQWNRLNQPLEAAHFERLKAAVLTHLSAQELFVRDLFAGADAEHRSGIRFVTPNAWHALFVHNMFLRPSPADLASFSPAWTVLHAPELQADPATHGTRSGTFVVIHFGQRTILIGGTRYAGEMKKSVFTILNYLLPKRGILSMHCSANLGRAGDVALFFGLSGTGKTTLSADPDRALIGDDEHGWSDLGIFNFEGGCYAKATCSTRFGAPFLPLSPNVYSSLLGAKIATHGVQCWLVNTGWTGGPYGVGQRIRLGFTRAMVRAALAGKLDRIPTTPDPVFGVEVPLQVPGVPEGLLLPRGTWSDPAAYDAQAARLAQMFRENFAQFQDQVHAAVADAGPRG